MSQSQSSQNLKKEVLEKAKKTLYQKVNVGGLQLDLKRI